MFCLHQVVPCTHFLAAEGSDGRVYLAYTRYTSSGIVRGAVLFLVMGRGRKFRNMADLFVAGITYIQDAVDLRMQASLYLPHSYRGYETADRFVSPGTR